MALEGVVGLNPAGPSGRSGLYLVQDGAEAFALRVMSARTAVRTLDLQYYIWHDDATGRLLAGEVLQAAERGVRVRVLLDDMDARRHDLKLAALDRHPNIEVRLFNPFRTRSGFIRTLTEVFLRGSRLNHRMHCKAWIADGRIALVGGRNIGDEYFAAAGDVNFIDLDLALTGAAVESTAQEFDRYWKNELSVPVSRLRKVRRYSDLERLRLALADASAAVSESPYTQALRDEPGTLAILRGEVRWTWSDDVQVIADDPRKALGGMHVRDRNVLHSMQVAVAAVQRELRIISPYFVPGIGGAASLRRLSRQGVAVQVLTNSLAATDVAAVHSGYMRYRRPLLEEGVALFELKPSAEDGTRFRLGSSKASLHTKALVLDRERIFVGSFNLDPRSADLNCEMGVWVGSPQLAGKLVEIFDQATDLRHSFQVLLEGNQLAWSEIDHDRTVQHVREPLASWTRRAVTRVLALLPIEAQL